MIIAKSTEGSTNSPSSNQKKRKERKMLNSLTQTRDFRTIIFTFSQFSKVVLFFQSFFQMPCKMAHSQGKIEQNQFPSSIERPNLK